MAWEWSHTDEAYQAVELNIEALPRAELKEVYAEILGIEDRDEEDPNSNYEFNEDRYQFHLKDADDKEDCELAEFIWNFASEFRTCDNGGFDAHVCPYGCHTVSFDNEGE